MNDHPHQRPSLSYDHISCDGQSFLCVYESLTSDHPSNTTTPMWFWGWSYKRGFYCIAKWWVSEWVSECICLSADISPCCSAHDEWLIMKLLQVCQVQYCQQCVKFWWWPNYMLTFKSNDMIVQWHNKFTLQSHYEKPARSWRRLLWAHAVLK